jgi:hypothetical protein
VVKKKLVLKHNNQQGEIQITSFLYLFQKFHIS